MFDQFDRGVLMDSDGAAGGDKPGALSAELQRAVNDEINKAISAWGKKELPKMIQTTFQQSMKELIPEIGQAVIGQIQEALPSDEELEQMEAQEQAQLQGGDEQQDPNGQYRIPPELNAELLDLRQYRQSSDERLAQLEREREESMQRAEELDRQNTIQGVLNKYQFANDASREIAFNYFANSADRDEEGNLVANGLPVGKFIEDHMGNLSGLLASRPVGGAGALPGGRAASGPQMENIKVGMGKQEWNDSMAAAVSLLPASVRGGSDV